MRRFKFLFKKLQRIYTFSLSVKSPQYSLHRLKLGYTVFDLHLLSNIHFIFDFTFELFKNPKLYDILWKILL